MLSASHNPMPDNGIKFFARGGHKLADELEDAIEAPAAASAWERPTGAAVGRVRRLRRRGRALRRAPRSPPAAPARRPEGRRRLRQRRRQRRRRRRPCARAGAEVVVIGAEPDGLNINDGCGSTHLEPLAGGGRRARRRRSASPTTATPTAAWRSTPTGAIVDGDQIMAILAARPARARACCADDTLVATVMSNLGLLLAMEARGHHGPADRRRRPLRAGGDARAAGYSLGGEQSGHVILLDHATTGDGVLTGLCCWPGWPRPAARWPSWPR